MSECFASFFSLQITLNVHTCLVMLYIVTDFTHTHKTMGNTLGVSESSPDWLNSETFVSF